MKVLGIDIGGTKCALTVANVEATDVEFLHKESFATTEFATTFGEIRSRAKRLVDSFLADWKNVPKKVSVEIF